MANPFTRPRQVGTPAAPKRERLESVTQLLPNEGHRTEHLRSEASCGSERSGGLSLADLWPTETEAKSQLILWRISTVVWAALIFLLSTATFSAVTTRWLLARAFAFVHVTVSPAAFPVVHVACRKLAHLTEYGIFSLLLCRSLAAKLSLGGGRQRVFWCVVAAAAAYSLTDEFHQRFVPGRHASVADCAIDSAGAALAMLLAFGYRRFVSDREDDEGDLT